MPVGQSSYPTSLDTVANLIEAGDDLGTTLTAQLNAGAATANVAATAGWPNSTLIVITSGAGVEIASYDTKTGTTFGSLARGLYGTADLTHTLPATVEHLNVARHHNVLSDAMRALQAKVGAGASLPANGKVLRGAATGTAWQDRTYRHVQGATATVWTITHNMNCRPSVTVVDSAKTRVEGQVEYLDDNNVRLTFSAAFSGEAYLN